MNPRPLECPGRGLCMLRNHCRKFWLHYKKNDLQTTFVVRICRATYPRRRGHDFAIHGGIARGGCLRAGPKGGAPGLGAWVRSLLPGGELAVLRPRSPVKGRIVTPEKKGPGPSPLGCSLRNITTHNYAPFCKCIFTADARIAVGPSPVRQRSSAHEVVRKPHFFQSGMPPQRSARRWHQPTNSPVVLLLLRGFGSPHDLIELTGCSA